MLGVALVGIVTSTGSSYRTAEPGYENYPTFSTTTTTTSATGTTVAAIPTTAERTSPRATPTAGQRTPATRREPPKPRPVPKLADNPLMANGLGVPKTQCSLPRWNASPAGQQAYYEAAVNCMARAWAPVLSAAGLPTEPPRVYTPTGRHSSPCGNRAATDNAYYCRGNIYMPPQYFTKVEGLRMEQPAVFLGVLAHEYGHHVQELSGIMQAAWSIRYDVGEESVAGLENSRRTELQATCFGGMVYAGLVGNGSVGRGLYDAALRDNYQRGDHNGRPRDHGHPQNNGVWFQHGAEKNRTAQCNTWSASPDSVA
ncbi:metalloprotease [Longimycelium tulufanense]|uniref:Metalloprotease n=1 Tax=Longimycelium tulufanense TaxID=907463 RepID=A0A8J3FT32_9PSEU|nr:neutral zinc metallopeptidase [Longimycelium tulufanense]GGM42114.1 metalloprotease [Longimycelium tulufanense]